MRSIPVLIALAVAAVVQPSVVAQSRVVLTTSSSPSRPDTTWLIQLPSQRIEATLPANLARGVFTASGRYFIAIRDDLPGPSLLQLWVADLGRGQVVTADLPGYNDAYVLANPRTEDVYAVLVSGLGAALARVGPAGVSILRRCDAAPPAVSRDGTRVFCHDAVDGLVWVDAASGATVDHFPIGGIGRLATDATGASVIVARPSGLSVVDIGARGVMRTAPLPLSPGIAYNFPVGDGPDAGGYFLHGGAPGAYETVLVDPVTLAARQRLPLPPDRSVRSIKVLPDGRTALVASSTGPQAVVDAIDLPTNRLTFSTPMFAAWQYASLTTTSVPLPPAALQANVTGTSVSLTWRVPPASDGVTGWVVEAGSRSGASDLAELRVAGGETSLAVTAVPPGRYFVRVRGANFNGASPPSNEVVLEVPPPAR